MTDVRFWRRRGGRPWVLGHRGASDAPENTMAAFELAIARGADGIEVDARLDGNGEVVVIHDATLERVTAGADPRCVGEIGRRELDTVDLGSGERVPILSTVLAWARARRLKLNVEVKPDVARPFDLVRRVAALARGLPDAPRHLLLSSAHPGIVRALAHLAPGVPRG